MAVETQGEGSALARDVPSSQRDSAFKTAIGLQRSCISPVAGGLQITAAAAYATMSLPRGPTNRSRIQPHTHTTHPRHKCRRSVCDHNQFRELNQTCGGSFSGLRALFTAAAAAAPKARCAVVSPSFGCARAANQQPPSHQPDTLEEVSGVAGVSAGVATGQPGGGCAAEEPVPRDFFVILEPVARLPGCQPRQEAPAWCDPS